MNPLVLNFTEMTRLAAFGPCIFIVIYLIFSARDYRLITIPVLYFICLTCTFILPLIAVFAILDDTDMAIIIVFNEFLQPTLGFLLIVQLILRKNPPLTYWVALATPLASLPFIYLSIKSEPICINPSLCADSTVVTHLYYIFSGTLLFLLLTLIFARSDSSVKPKDDSTLHKYWLIVMLIIYNLLMIFITVLLIFDVFVVDETTFIKTMIGIAFVYLVLSSVFRVFNKNFHLAPLVSILTNRDARIANRINIILEQETPYLSLGFQRHHLADKLGLTEQHLSRIINQTFEKSFTDLMNARRIKHAISLLSDNKHSVTDIAYQSGFNSIPTFNRVFKNITGCTPSKFKEKG